MCVGPLYPFCKWYIPQGKPKGKPAFPAGSIVKLTMLPKESTSFIVPMLLKIFAVGTKITTFEARLKEWDKNRLK